jgi:hypothetical protein
MDLQHQERANDHLKAGTSKAEERRDAKKRRGVFA